MGREAARLGAAAASPLAPLALNASRSAGAVARAAVLATGPRPDRTLDRLRAYIDGFGARFDGRLRVAAVDRRSGRRVMFGEPGAPAASVPDAVLASCAVPWLFAPVEIGGREYVDGGVWSPVNLDAAPVRRGARRRVPERDRRRCRPRPGRAARCAPPRGPARPPRPWRCAPAAPRSR